MYVCMYVQLLHSSDELYVCMYFSMYEGIVRYQGIRLYSELLTQLSG